MSITSHDSLQVESPIADGPSERDRRLHEGLLAEYRHLLHDEDPDSTVPAIRVSLIKPSRSAA